MKPEFPSRERWKLLQSVIQPTIGVFTCLGDAHQENFTSYEQKCLEKLKLFKDAKSWCTIWTMRA